MKSSSNTDSYVFQNLTINKNELKKLISWSFSKYDRSKTTYISDKLKTLGFSYATRAGISLSIEDLKVPETKKHLVNETFSLINETEQNFLTGQITSVERFQKIIDTWNDTSELLKEEIVTYFKETDPLNAIYIMAFSGARGNISQVRQLVGMRGLMSDPQGQIIDLPIKSNFREGLTVTEYLISSYGARKGLVDTALRTADSGYLTRRLVDVAQDVIIREIDCGTVNGIELESLEKLKGRVTLNNIFDSESSEILIPANFEIDTNCIELLKEKSIEKVSVRSPLTCESQRSVCQLCYGSNLAYDKVVDLGDAVGIIAAQSIGEPGTQLTMRTFHTGGVFTRESLGQIRAPFEGTIYLSSTFKYRYKRTNHGKNGRNLQEPISLRIISKNDEITFDLTTNTVLLVKHGQEVKKNEILAERSLAADTITERATKDIKANISGEVCFGDLIIEERLDKQGNSSFVNKTSGIVWLLSGHVYEIPVSTNILFSKNNSIIKNFPLAKINLYNNFSGIINQFHIQKSKNISLVNRVITSKLEPYILSRRDQQNILTSTSTKDEFVLSVSLGSTLKSSQVIAEQTNTNYQISTGGSIFVEEKLETKKILWIPEEIYEINKDASLLLSAKNSFIESDVEFVREYFSKNSGFLQVLEQNQILKEVSIKPGVLYKVDRSEDLSLKDKVFIKPGEIIYDSVLAENLTFLEVVTNTFDEVCLLARPVISYEIKKESETESHDSTLKDNVQKPKISDFVKFKFVQNFSFTDGTRIKSDKSVNLVTNQLVVEFDDKIDSLIESNSENFNVILDSVATEEGLSKLHLVFKENLSFNLDSITESQIKRNVFLVNLNQTIKPFTRLVQKEMVSCKVGKIQSMQLDRQRVSKILTSSLSDTRIFRTTKLYKLGDFIQYNSGLKENNNKYVIGQVISKSVNRYGKNLLSYSYRLRFAQPYLISSGAVLNVNHSNLVSQGDLLSVLVFERAKTGDIVQGLPRIEEILEARKLKNSSELSPISGVLSCDEVSDNHFYDITIRGDESIKNLQISKSNKLLRMDGDNVTVGQQLTDGKINPHELLNTFFNYYSEHYGMFEATRLSLQKVQIFLINEVQKVYQSQGVSISDKHVEIIVKQMTSKVKILNGGTTTLLPDELVDLTQIKHISKTQQSIHASYVPILLGITKASLNTDSFISAASFQETTRILTEAAIEGKTDWLRGLKENVIIGRLIPAGTGFNDLYTKPSLHNPFVIEKKDNKIQPELKRDQIIFDNIILDDRISSIEN